MIDLGVDIILNGFCFLKLVIVNKHGDLRKHLNAHDLWDLAFAEVEDVEKNQKGFFVPVGGINVEAAVGKVRHRFFRTRRRQSPLEPW